MRPVKRHIPGQPKGANPPRQLLQVVEKLQHDAAEKVGVSATAEGEWAVLVSVPQDASVPIQAIEEQAQGFPVIYQAKASRVPVARPAYPHEET